MPASEHDLNTTGRDKGLHPLGCEPNQERNGQDSGNKPKVMGWGVFGEHLQQFNHFVSPIQDSPIMKEISTEVRVTVFALIFASRQANNQA